MNLNQGHEDVVRLTRVGDRQLRLAGFVDLLVHGEIVGYSQSRSSFSASSRDAEELDEDGGDYAAGANMMRPVRSRKSQVQNCLSLFKRFETNWVLNIFQLPKKHEFPTP
jgi:hypothetical protein